MAEPNTSPSPREDRSTSASGERAVAVGGSVLQSVIVTGDNNTVNVPAVERLFDGVITLAEWDSQSRQGITAPWVEFDSRSQLIEEVRSHLRARSGRNVLHLAGLSGVGKTRTVLEACRGQADLERVLYVPRYEQGGAEVLLHLTRDQRHAALVVLDEVRLEELQTISSVVGEQPNRIRIVTVGPARRGERSRPAEKLFVLAEPPNEGVLGVVRSAGAALSEPVQKSIVRFAAHDLRLALMLVAATLSDGDFRDLPVRDGEDVWRRVTNLYRDQLGSLEAFRCHYPYLTAAVDLGIKGQLRGELEYVAGQFPITTAHLDSVIGFAARCGLGVVTPSFFEPTPRALAGHLFRERVWDSVRHRLPEFLGGMSNRLRRRFLERCHECAGEQREGMEDAVAEYFQAALGAPGLLKLADREPSRLFAAWAELDPDRALPWLQQAVGRASDENLAAFTGDPDGSGGWRGRRQVVWLCEHLATFAESFRACEAILFRLAQVETEPTIGNNSTVTWRGLFLPALAFTEVSFPERADLLLHRLEGADERTLPLVFSAVVEALGNPGMRLAPPAVVGGRVVPEPWRPSTLDDWRRLQADLAARSFQAIARLPGGLADLGRHAVVAHLSAFVALGLVRELRQLLPDGDERLGQVVRPQLRLIVARRGRAEARRPTESPDTRLADVCRWEADLHPAGLAERVRELTGMNYWDATEGWRGAGDRRQPSPYSELALDILREPEAMPALREWLDSASARSSLNLGAALGEADAEGTVAALVAGWLAEGRCRDLVAGYVRSVSARAGSMPVGWARLLDEVAASRPEYAALVTANADFSPSGFQRIARLIGSGAVAPAVWSVFTSSQWEPHLGNGERATLLDLLLNRSSGDPQPALAAAVGLGADWTGYGERPLPPELARPLLQALRESLGFRVDPSAWSAVAEALAPAHPEEAADLLTDALTSPGPLRCSLADDVVRILLGLARQHPHAVMEAVGRRLLDPARRDFFGLSRFGGLFEAVGTEEVRRWLTDHQELARYVARHLDTPRLLAGAPFIPPVTEWVMGEFGSDDRVFFEFCAGRHALEVQAGHARDRRAALEVAMGPFRRHELDWVRRWAENELADNERDAELDDYLDDRVERM